VSALGIWRRKKPYQDFLAIVLKRVYFWPKDERKDMEEKLKFLEFTIDSIPDAVYCITLDGRFCNVNAAACGMLGYSREELLLLSVHDIDPDYTHEEGQSDLEELRLTGTLKLKRFHATKDCRIIPVEITSNYFTYNKCEYICCIVRDITDRREPEEELRENEEKFRVLADTSPAAICVYQGEYLVYLNPAMIQLTGYTEQELMEMRFWDWMHPEFRESVRERGLARQRGELVPSPYELKCITKNGEEKWLFLSAGRIDYKGRPAGIVTMFDINDRKRMEEELLQAHYDLEKRVEERTADFRNANELLLQEITDRKRAEEALRESESAVRRKLESILDPEGEIGELDLADILDAQGIQALMEDLNRLAGIKMSIIDLKGRVLVDVGWQDICLEFHRAHPETRLKCLESDTGLAVGVPPGEFRQYKCMNNMWHLVTPIIVGGRHMGNLFMGQFFFQKEEVDYDLFRAQARRYGFPEDQYMAALEAVPRHSEECVNMGKAVFLRLTDMFSKLSYANIKLARTLTEREQLMATLREANLVVENSPVVLFRWTADEEWPVELVSGNVIQFGYTPEEFLSGAISYSSIIHPDDLEGVTCKVRSYCSEGDDQFRLEYRIITKGGNIHWVNEHTQVERNPEGRPTHFQGIVIDVTGRKEIEEALWEAHEELESRVRERTGQLTSLTAELSLAEERARRHIATELHDHVGQTLILSKLKLNSLKERDSSAEYEALLGEISNHIGNSIEDIRSLTFQLSPPLLYEVGFEAAVEWLADELAERHGFRVDFRDDGKKKPLNEETRVALYQMVRELIINVVKHADAKRVDISIGRFANRIRIIVSDDGSGFDNEAIQRRLTGNRSLGLFNIRHRIEYLGGEFAIESEIGRGTRITLLLPVTENGVKSHAEEN
jgi:PAS domain S-box-containing protein